MSIKQLNIAQSLQAWLPSRGNVIFTLLACLVFFLAGKAGAVSLGAPLATAASTAIIPYQGRLTNASGVPLSGSYNITFKLYNVSSSGSPLWQESWPSAQVTNGLFNVLLGSTTPITQSIITSNSSLWLGIKVGADTEMTPRAQIGSVPFALQSNYAYGLSASDGNPLQAVSVDSGGNVGIGTTNPSARLSIAGDTTFTGYSDGQLHILGATTANKRMILGYDTTSNYGFIQPVQIGVGYSNLVLNYFGGNVGIGTASPGYKLNLTKDGGGGNNAQLARFSDSSAVNSVGPLHFTFGADNHFAFNAGITLAGSNSLSLAVGDGSDLANQRKLTVLSSGNVGIGTTSVSNILTIVQSSSTDPIADAWTTYSSKRWKTNIKTIDNALDLVRQLRGVRFDWTADGKSDIGLVAEEVGQVVPEVVVYEANGVDARSVDYARLVAMLIEAIKQQQTQIEDQEAGLETQQEQIAALRQQNNDLESRVTALEKVALAGDAPLGNPLAGGWNTLLFGALGSGLLVLAGLVIGQRYRR